VFDRLVKCVEGSGVGRFAAVFIRAIGPFLRPPIPPPARFGVHVDALTDLLKRQTFVVAEADDLAGERVGHAPRLLGGLPSYTTYHRNAVFRGGTISFAFSPHAFGVSMLRSW